MSDVPEFEPTDLTDWPAPTEHLPECPCNKESRIIVNNVRVYAALSSGQCPYCVAISAALAAQATAHEAALAEAERRLDAELKAWIDAGYREGVSDERARIRAGVEIALLGTLQSTRDRVLAVIDGEGE